MNYIINKVLLNKKNELVEKQTDIKCLGMYNNLSDSIDYINNLKHINILSEDIIINNEITKKSVNNKDIDGYHLIMDDTNSRRFNIYIKTSELNKGYIYNSVDINIIYIGFIEIIAHKLNVKKNAFKKKIITSYENSDSSFDSEIENKPKRKKIEKQQSNNHIHMELNDKMLEELKIKLQTLSMNIKNK